MAAFVGLLIALGAHTLYAFAQTRVRMHQAPSGVELRQAVSYNSGLNCYRQGGDLLKSMSTMHPDKVTAMLADMDAANCVEHRVITDFLQTLTPTQVDSRSGVVSFSDLSARQQAILTQLPGYVSRHGGSAQNSFLTIQIWRMGQQKPYVAVQWWHQRRDGVLTTYNTNKVYWLTDPSK
jgi:hypothetical protein